MPTYDYQCDTNGQVLEVRHPMKDHLSTWGELCRTMGIEMGETPSDAPIRKLATGGNVVSKSSLGSGSEPARGTGPCCGGGMCGL